MKLVSIDTETTGLDPATSELLELGIVVFDSKYLFEPKASNSLRIVFCKEQIQGNVFAIDMNKELIAEIKEYNNKFKNIEDGLLISVTPTLTTIYVNVTPVTDSDNFFSFTTRAALKKLADEVTKFLVDADAYENGKLNIAGKNFVGFDKAFISKFDDLKEVIINKARHRVLDVGSMYVDPQVDDCLPNLATCLKRAGFENTVPHNAVDDAILVIKVAQAAWNVTNEKFAPDGDNFMGIPTLEQIG